MSVLGFTHCPLIWTKQSLERFTSTVARSIFEDWGNQEQVGVDPMVIFLSAIDRDEPMNIPAGRCNVVANRLEELVSGWDKSAYTYVQGSMLIEALRECAKRDENLQFATEIEYN